MSASGPKIISLGKRGVEPIDGILLREVDDAGAKAPNLLFAYQAAPPYTKAMSLQGEKTILLVEDEAIIALAEKAMLERHGYAVLVARSGEEAVAIADSGRELSLILMDINLGAGMDGTQAAELILARHDIPLAFLSSHTEPEVVDKTEGITSYGYIVKNSGETVLLASIRMAFRLFKARAELRDKEEHYRSLFEHDVGAVWVEDFSGFKRRVDELKRRP